MQRVHIALFALLFAVPQSASAAPPTLEQTKREAVRAAGLAKTSVGWAARSRLRHLVPRAAATVSSTATVEDHLEFRETIATGPDDRLLLDGASNKTVDATSDRLYWSVRVWWDVADLVFDRNELAADREIRARAHERESILLRVHTAYRSWESALAAAQKQSDPDTRVELMARVHEAEGILDAATNGWFLRQLKRGTR